MLTRSDDSGYREMLHGVRLKSLVWGERTLLTEVRLARGAVVPVHDHPHEQTGYLLAALGRAHASSGRYPESRHELERALAILEAVDDSYRLVRIEAAAALSGYPRELVKAGDVVSDPLVASGVLTILLAAYFLLDGLSEMAAAFSMRPAAGWGWLLLGWLPVAGLVPLYWWAIIGDPRFNAYLLVWPYDRIGFGPEVGPLGYDWRAALFINTRLKLYTLGASND